MGVSTALLGQLASVTPDTLAMLWELAKIVLGVSVASLPPLLIWIGRLIRATLRRQEKQTRQLEGEDGRGGLITDVHDIKQWKDQITAEVLALTGHVGDIQEWRYREENGERRTHTRRHQEGQ